MGSVQTKKTNKKKKHHVAVKCAAEKKIKTSRIGEIGVGIKPVAG